MRPTAKAIAIDIATQHGITLDDMKARTRGRLVDVARSKAYKEIRTRLHWPYQQIGDFFGGRSHAAVISGIKSLENRMDDPAEMAVFMRQRLNYLSGQSAMFDIARRLNLKSQDAIVLAILIRNAPRPLTLAGISELYDHAWQSINTAEKFICESTVKSAISKIRAAVKAQGLPVPIDTIKPRGYVLCDEFALWV